MVSGSLELLGFSRADTAYLLIGSGYALVSSRSIANNERAVYSWRDRRLVMAKR